MLDDDPLLFALFLHALAQLYGEPRSRLERELRDWPAWYRPRARA